MADDKDTSTPPPAPQNPNDISALLETPVYELVEKGDDRRGYETRDIKPGESK